MSPYVQRKDIPEKVKEELKGYSPLLQKLLYYRDIKTKKQAELFIEPDWSRDSNDPLLILGMGRAVERILEAIEKNEKIVIYSDYDADGIPGAVILHDFFKKVGHENFSNYIPHRHDEGYGMNKDAVEIFIEDEVQLLITIDLGITETNLVDFAQKNGIDVIVTDHHLPKEEKGKEKLPKAFVVLNSKQKGDKYPDDMLCGAAVVFKLVQAILKKGKEDGKFSEISEGWEKWLLDMVGLATLADMVPLKKENRLLAHFGMIVLRKSRRLGLQTILRKMKINQKYLTEDDLGFMLVPRINAASRMDHPLRAFELLSTDDAAEAEKLADHLNSINDKRKGHVASMVKEVKKRMDKRELKDVIVIGDTKWLPGVLGIAANKLVEDYKRPVFMWGYDGNGVIKGSCRGIGTVSVVELMRGAPKGTFVDIGGHRDAGGFSVEKNAIHTLEDTLSEIYRNMEKVVGGDTVFVDQELSLDDVTWKTFVDIDKLSPFGSVNEKPLFLFKDIEIANSRLFGKEKNHLGLDFLNSRGSKISSIGFFMGKETFSDVSLEVGEKINMIAVLEKSMFRNIPELRLRIEVIFPVAVVKKK